jgi:charged multivesicular body protein 2A
MQSTSQTLKRMTADSADAYQTAMAYARQSAEMESATELMQDALIDEFDEEEEEMVMSQVLDEVGVCLDSSMVDAPSVSIPSRAIREETRSPTPQSLER